MIDQNRILDVLRRCWSKQTSSKWTLSNPALGQCSVTALVLQDYFGGRLLKTKVGDAWHFYNEIQHIAYDFTAEQFSESIEYTHQPANRAEALADTTLEQYQSLSESFSAKWPVTGAVARSRANETGIEG